MDTNVGSLSLPEGLRPVTNQKSKAVKAVGKVYGIDHPKESAHVKNDQGSSNSFHTKLRSPLPKAIGLPSTSCAQNFLGEIIETRLVVY